jgi:hypothetical protein
MDARRADILAALLNGRLVVDPDTDHTDTATGITTTAAAATGDAPSTGGAAYDRVTGERLTGNGSTSVSTGQEPTGAGSTADKDTAGAGTDPANDVTAPGRPIHPVSPGKPLIQIVIPYSTLIGAGDQPAELTGHGPIPAGLAREAAADGVWRRLVTDPLSGTLLDYGRTTYHPPAGLADHIRARDLYCRAPGCRRRAADAELDHITAWSRGGTTSEQNLAAYCTHGHRIKTYAPGWKVEAHPDGSLTWTTPTGHRHTTRPHDYRPEPPSAPKPPPPAGRPAPPPNDPEPDPPPF